MRLFLPTGPPSLGQKFHHKGMGAWWNQDQGGLQAHWWPRTSQWPCLTTNGFHRVCISPLQLGQQQFWQHRSWGTQNQGFISIREEDTVLGVKQLLTGSWVLSGLCCNLYFFKLSEVSQVYKISYIRLHWSSDTRKLFIFEQILSQGLQDLTVPGRWQISPSQTGMLCSISCLSVSLSV